MMIRTQSDISSMIKIMNVELLQHGAKFCCAHTARVVSVGAGT